MIIATFDYEDVASQLLVTRLTIVTKAEESIRDSYGFIESRPFSLPTRRAATPYLNELGDFYNLYFS